MNKKKQQIWLEQGYAFIAQQGFDRLGIHEICRAAEKGKSSFYHYFGDLEVFKKDLMDYHLERAHGFAAAIKKCNNTHTDLIAVLMAYKVDVFFYKQVRLQAEEALYQPYNKKIFRLYEGAVLDHWAAHFDLEHKRILVEKFNKFLSEHFLMAISFNRYTENWINRYLMEVSEMVQQMKI